MAEIHTGTAAGVDRAVFSLAGDTLATIWFDRRVSFSVVLQLT